MPSHQPVFRIAKIDAEQTAYMRHLAQLSRELLRQPVADTFLGRKTYEPFPKEDEKTSFTAGRGESLMVSSCRQRQHLITFSSRGRGKRDQGGEDAEWRKVRKIAVT